MLYLKEAFEILDLLFDKIMQRYSLPIVVLLVIFLLNKPVSYGIYCTGIWIN